MTGAIAILGYVLKVTNHFVIDLEQFQTNLMSNQMTQIFTMSGLIMFAMHLFIPNLLMQNTNLAPRDLAPYASGTPAASTAQAKIQKYAAANIVRLAMLEASAMMGFLAAIMTNEATPYIVLAALGIATIFATMPSEESIREKTGLK